MAVQLPDSTSNRQTYDYCDVHVTADFRRIYGTDAGRAKRCSECESSKSARLGDVLSVS